MLSSSGKSKGQKDRNVLSKVQNFFKPRSSTCSSETAPLAEKQSTIELYLEKSSATKTEKSCTLKSVMSSYCARSNEKMNEILAAMFLKFEATKSFQMSQSKSMCVVNHGLAS